jgi:hypothetical protein
MGGFGGFARREPRAFIGRRSEQQFHAESGDDDGFELLSAGRGNLQIGGDAA